MKKITQLVKREFIIIIMALVLIHSTIIFAAPDGAPNSEFPIFYNVNEEFFILATHGSSLESGNWIELSGDGTQITLPSVNVALDIPSNAQTSTDSILQDDSLASFFEITGWGTGTQGMTASDDTVEVYSGTDSLLFANTGTGSYARPVLRHRYSTTQDWSSSTGFYLYFYGTGSGKIFTISLKDSLAVEDTWTFSDDTADTWVREEVDFSSVTIDLTSIQTIQIAFPVETSIGSYRIDQIGLVSGADTTFNSLITVDDFTYPLTSHPIYLEGDTINAEFWGSTGIAGDSGLEWRLLTGTQTDVMNAITDTIKGNTDTFKNLIDSSSAVWASTGVTLDTNGDTTISLTAPAPGNYVLILISEATSPYKLVLYGVTPVEVVDYQLTTTIPSYVYSGFTYDIAASLSGASTSNYVYGAVMIENSAYSLDFDITTDSTLVGTTISVNNEPLVEGQGTIDAPDFMFPGISDISAIDTAEITTKLSNIFPTGKIAVGFTSSTSTSSTISISTSGLTLGTYKVLIATFEPSTNRIVGFDLKSINVISAPSGGGGGYVPSGGGGGGGITLPVPAVIELSTPSDAKKLLDDFNPRQIASVLKDVSINKVIAILELFDDSTASKILMELTPTMASNIILSMNETRAMATIGLLDPTSAGIIEEMAQTNMTKTAILIEGTVKALIADVDPAARPGVLKNLSDVLENLSVENLVQLFIEISNLPETPDIVAYLLEPMDSTFVSTVVTTWINSTGYNSLITVIEVSPSSVIDKIYTVMTSEQRLEIYSQLSATIISQLPTLSTFEVTDLSITPDTITPGESVDISFKVTNIGSQTDDYKLDVMINSVLEQTYSAIVSAGESTTISLQVSKELEGTYTVKVGDQESTFKVEQTVTPVITPGSVKASTIEIIPKITEVGSNLLISVGVNNPGDESAESTIELQVDGVTTDSKDVTLAAGAAQSIIFEIKANYDAGTHTISVDGVSSEVTLTEVKQGLPWLTIAVIIIIIAIGGAFILRRQGYF